MLFLAVMCWLGDRSLEQVKDPQKKGHNRKDNVHFTSIYRAKTTCLQGTKWHGIRRFHGLDMALPLPLDPSVMEDSELSYRLDIITTD